MRPQELSPDILRKKTGFFCGTDLAGSACTMGWGCFCSCGLEEHDYSRLKVKALVERLTTLCAGRKDPEIFI